MSLWAIFTRHLRLVCAITVRFAERKDKFYRWGTASYVYLRMIS